MNRIKIVSVLLSMSLIAAVMPVSAIAYDSTAETVEYKDASGKKHEVSAYKLDGTEDKLESGFYYVDKDQELTFDHTVYLSGDVSIIVLDGASVVLGNNSSQFGFHYYEQDDSCLHIYGSGDDITDLSIKVDQSDDSGAAIVTDSVEMVDAKVKIVSGKAEGIVTTKGISVVNTSLTVESTTSALIQTIDSGDIVFNNSTLSLGNTAPDYSVWTEDGDLIIEDSSLSLGRIISIRGDVDISSQGGSNKIQFGKINCFGRFTLKGDSYLKSGTSYYYGELSSSQTDSLEGLEATLGTGLIVPYINNNGKAAEHDASRLDADTDISKLKGWYFVEDDVTFDEGAKLAGDTYIIVADGKTLSFGSSGSFLDEYAVDGEDHNLTIYGQEDQTGSIKAYSTSAGIACDTYSQYGANVSITAPYDCIEVTGLIKITEGKLDVKSTDDGGAAIEANKDGSIVIEGGEVTVNSARTGIYADGGILISGGVLTADAPVYGVISNYDFTIIGGKVTVNGGDNGLVSYKGDIALGYTNYNDFIMANDYDVSNGIMAVINGQAFTYGDGTNVISGTLSAEQISAIAGQKLIPSSAPIARLEGYSLSLDGDIGVNYYLSLDGTDNISNTRVSFDIGGKEVGNELLDPDNTYTAGGKTYYCFPVKLSPSQMTMPITATVTNGSTVILVDDSFTVRDYAEYLLNDSEYADYAATLLHYGSACQRAFDVNTSDLADKDLDSKYDLDVDAAVNAIKSYNQPFVFDKVFDGVSYYGSTFGFKSDLYIRCYFKLENGYSASDLEVPENSLGLEYGVDGTGLYVYVQAPVKFADLTWSKVIELDDKNDDTKRVVMRYVNPQSYMKYIVTNRQAGDGYYDAVIALYYLEKNAPKG